ncbi:hypothetical protein F4808DRAFT_266381 [Astrocystis sublimbata]|nr:hypothetical protein F4808DRAFT_266381 [Astrocystis sublimbata]
MEGLTLHKRRRPMELEPNPKSRSPSSTPGSITSHLKSWRSSRDDYTPYPLFQRDKRASSVHSDLSNPVPKITDTTLYDLSDKCYSAFERLLEAEGDIQSPTDEPDCSVRQDLPGLKNSFSFWVEYTGALAPVGASLDDRLVGYVEIKEMIIELLEMVERHAFLLERISASEEPSRWDQSLSGISAALDRLHFLASAIRKASSTRKFGEEVLLNLETDEEVLFKITAIAYVKWKFPKARKGLREHLGFTIAARRKLMSKKSHHANKLATRRRHPTSADLEGEWPDQSAEMSNTAGFQYVPPLMPREENTLSKRPAAGTEVTQASILNPHLVVKYIHHSKPTLSIRSQGTSRRDESLKQRYPPLPKVEAGERHVPCPYCRQPLRAAELRGSEGADFWERHIDNDLQPYACIFTQCVAQFFVHRSDWAQHMNTAHGTDWPRRVHCATWFCDLGHAHVAEFDNEADWRSHMRDAAEHPGRKKSPTEAQLKALEVKKQQFALRDEYVCPLCEEIPEKISVVGDKGNPMDMKKTLEDHIARHIKDLSFISLPVQEVGEGHETADDSNTSDDTKTKVSTSGSAFYPPTISELMATMSLRSVDCLDGPTSTNIPGVINKENRYTTWKNRRNNSDDHHPWRDNTYSREMRRRDIDEFKLALKGLSSQSRTTQNDTVDAWLYDTDPLHTSLDIPISLQVSSTVATARPQFEDNIHQPERLNTKLEQKDQIQIEPRPTPEALLSMEPEAHWIPAEMKWRDNGGRRQRDTSNQDTILADGFQKGLGTVFSRAQVRDPASRRRSIHPEITQTRHPTESLTSGVDTDYDLTPLPGVPPLPGQLE